MWRLSCNDKLSSQNFRSFQQTPVLIWRALQVMLSFGANSVLLFSSFCFKHRTSTVQSAGARGLSQCQWIFLILFCLPFLLLCSKGGLCWESRAQSENKSIYTFGKCQVKIYNSVYHSRVAFPRQHKCNILFCTLNTIQKHGLCWTKSTGGGLFFH